MRSFVLTLLLCFAASSLWAQAEIVKHPIQISDWLAVGPFSSGSRERGIDFLLEHGGEAKIQPCVGMQHHSFLAPGGVVRWHKTTAIDGKIPLAYKNVNWEALQEAWGWMGLANVGYAYAEYQHLGTRQVALILADKAGCFYWNGCPFPGDVYGRHYVYVPVMLKPGNNRILVRVGGWKEPKFSFKIFPVSVAIFINTFDLTAPDLVRRQPLDSWLGVPVAVTSERPLQNITITLDDKSGYLQPIRLSIKNLLPLTVQKLAIPIRTNRSWPEADFAADTLWANLKVEADGQKYTARIPLRVVNFQQPHRVTYLSDIDSSVQYFAVLPPKNFAYDQEKRYALILSAHGASVEAIGQAMAYEPKDWAFIVAATNRRPYGFDWQDWGRLDVLQVLQLAKSIYPIDSDRVYLTGHSMGGHGTWHIGLHHADQFAAIAPSAGWDSFQFYVPLFLQKGEIFGQPQMLAIRDAVLQEERASVFVENAQNLPVYILQGSEDDEVPPTHARHLFGLLKRLGYEVVYNEVPGKGHWWNVDSLPGGTSCVDHPALMEFLRKHKLNSAPRRVVFKTTDLSVNNRLYWVQIDRLQKLYQEAVVTAEINNEHEIEISLQNVAQVQFLPEALTRLIQPGKLRLIVNKQVLTTRWQRENRIVLSLHNDRYRLGTLKQGKLTKTPALYGPLRQAYFTPFVFVYGTKEDANQHLHAARILAEEWWWRGNGFVTILADTQVTSEIIQKYNLILFGGPRSNFLTQRLQDYLPIKISNEGVTLGAFPIPGSDLAVKFIYPNPLNPNKFVVVNAGTSPLASCLSERLSLFYTGVGFPDFMIFDLSFKEKGWGSMIAAGFFDQNWQVAKEYCVVR
ncbi:hypothetical protein DRQ11_12575 [candidate division KSB1 bacterium]|nr:MAG: hypothetical protein DRQ11_12575 [candidate division KSB1 bacterium]